MRRGTCSEASRSVSITEQTDVEQVVETAAAITSTLLGDKLQVAADMDTYSRRIPLGVCSAITPFNFPAM